MAKLLYEVTTVVGSYTNSENQQKNRYHRIGSVIETKNGPMLKIDNIPVMDGGWPGWCYLNPPREKEKFEGLPRDEDIDY